MEWTEKTGDGIKRTVRVAFPGGGKINWQFKRSDQLEWDYDSAPSASDWETLEEKMDALYHRRRAPYKNLELVRALRKLNG